MDNIELQESSLSQMISTLEYIADFEMILSYKESVPYVHVIMELQEQWKSSFDLLGRNWFNECFTSTELDLINKFNEIFIDELSNFKDKLPAADVYIKTNEALLIRKKAILLLNRLEDRFDKKHFWNSVTRHSQNPAEE